MPTSLLLFAPSALVPVPKVALGADLSALVAVANDYAADARAVATRRAYESDFRAFASWCEGRGLAALPATSGTVAVYLASLADGGKRPSTVERALSGIVHAHPARGFAWERGAPAIAQVMAGIRRRHGTAHAQKAPLGGRAWGALGAARRAGRRATGPCTSDARVDGGVSTSELVALDVADVTRTREGLVVCVRLSKSDQEGRGGGKAIPYASRAALCPVRALDEWLGAARIVAGALFRGLDRMGRVHEVALNDRSVARVVQQAAARAGWIPRRSRDSRCARGS